LGRTQSWQVFPVLTAANDPIRTAINPQKPLPN